MRYPFCGRSLSRLQFQCQTKCRARRSDCRERNPLVSTILLSLAISWAAKLVSISLLCLLLLSYLMLSAARRYSTQGNRDMVPDSAPNDNNAQPGQPFHSSAPPPYRAADNVQSSTSQRSWTSTPEASDTRFDQGSRQEMRYSQQRYLNSADIQATRRTPSTLHDTFWHTPLRGSSGLDSDPLYQPRSSYPVSPPCEDQYNITELQAMPQTLHLDSLGSRSPYQRRGMSSFPQYFNATCQENALTSSFSGNEIESLSPPVLQAQLLGPPRLPPRGSPEG